MKHNDEFRDWLIDRFQNKLPGSDAQYNLAPLKRKEEEEAMLLSNSNPKESAVMMIMYPNGDNIEIPMILRNVYDGVHSGQIGLPGGKKEETDQDLLFTAIRETKEEINVDIKREDVIGNLSPLFVPVSNFVIHPFISWINEIPSFVPDASEVQKVFRVPLTHLRNPENIQSKSIEVSSGLKIKAPGIPIEDHFLWGATAMMIAEFLEILKDYR